MLPGRRLEIPPLPVTYRPVGIGTPLTELAVPPLGPLLPSEPAADVLAPGNGVIKVNPLCVKMIIPRFGVARSDRCSRIQSLKSGRNFK